MGRVEKERGGSQTLDWAQWLRRLYMRNRPYKTGTTDGNSRIEYGNCENGWETPSPVSFPFLLFFPIFFLFLFFLAKTVQNPKKQHRDTNGVHKQHKQSQRKILIPTG